MRHARNVMAFGAGCTWSRTSRTQRWARSARVGAVRVTAVPDGDHTHSGGVAELVDDAVGPHAIRPQPAEPAAQLMPDVRVAFEFTERIHDGVCQQKVE